MARPALCCSNEPSLGLARAVVDHMFEIIRAIHAEGVDHPVVEQNVVRRWSRRPRYVLEGPRCGGRGAAVLREQTRSRRAYLDLATAEGPVNRREHMALIKVKGLAYGRSALAQTSKRRRNPHALRHDPRGAHAERALHARTDPSHHLTSWETATRLRRPGVLRGERGRSQAGGEGPAPPRWIARRARGGAPCAPARPRLPVRVVYGITAAVDPGARQHMNTGVEPLRRAAI